MKKNVETRVQSSFDAIGLFLCIYVVQKYEQLTKQRNCMPLLGYFDAVMEMLWQRFDFMMRLHINSVAEIDTHKLQSLDARPHYVSRSSFGTLSHSFNRAFILVADNPTICRILYKFAQHKRKHTEPETRRHSGSIAK